MADIFSSFKTGNFSKLYLYLVPETDLYLILSKERRRWISAEEFYTRRGNVSRQEVD